MSSSGLNNAELVVGSARVRLEGEKPVWFVDNDRVEPGAGSGVAAQIVDAVCGSGSTPNITGGGDRERAIPVDQTHTSVIVDERWVVKIVGAWGSADRSAAILERLRQAGSTAAPGFAGALEWRHPERGRGVLALVAEYVPDSDDGWTWAVDDVLAYLADGDHRGAGSAVLPEWPARIGVLTAEMHAALRLDPSEAEAHQTRRLDEAKDPRSDDLANATAVFDRVFASIERGSDPVALREVAESNAGEILRSASQTQDDEVTPRPRQADERISKVDSLLPNDLTREAEAISPAESSSITEPCSATGPSSVTGNFCVTEPSSVTGNSCVTEPSSVILREVAESNAAFAARMSNRKAALAAAIRTIPGDSTAALVIPHGDFHVGQLLRTRAGRYFVLDFDGDPQWSAERRLRPDGAARDVAHMMASIDLVAAVVQRRLGRADERAWAWGDAAKQQYLESYLAVSEPGLLDVSALDGLVAEQLLIELSYAEHYLPEWRYAPDGVITRRYPPDFNTGQATDNLTGGQRLATEQATEQTTEQTEPKWNPPALPTT